jgi:hypothetical protein
MEVAVHSKELHLYIFLHSVFEELVRRECRVTAGPLIRDPHDSFHRSASLLNHDRVSSKPCILQMHISLTKFVGPTVVEKQELGRLC